jgi:predicted enzyme related to lactoylglutathione lyase
MSRWFGMAVLFVDKFDACLEFYQALGMNCIHLFRGAGHPHLAILERDGFRLALHAEREGPPHKLSSLSLNFFVDDIETACKNIDQFGGKVGRRAEEANFRPSQLVRAFMGTFADPDGNQHYIVQVIEAEPI